MFNQRILPLALLGAGSLVSAVPAAQPLITPPARLVPRQNPTACMITPTVSFPGLCPALLGGHMPTFQTMLPPSTGTGSSSSGSSIVSCIMQKEDPSIGINSAYYVYVSGSSSTTAVLLSMPSTVDYTQICDYSTMPRGTAIVTPSNCLGPAPTNTAICQVCTPYAINGNDCTTMSDCTPKAAAATVTAGTSPVDVGTLTGSALCTSISSALESLWPTVTNNEPAQCVETDTVTIGEIVYYESAETPNEELFQDGTITVSAIGSYNVTSLRDAMINSISSTIEFQAGKHCHDQTYIQWESKKKRDTQNNTVANFGGPGVGRQQIRTRKRRLAIRRRYVLSCE